ncbi:peptidylprolyl isomerase [uncultured Piscinibacter sp.]|uniref:peptidylprolyl isomerase n=1 Tax=uncultured Piscinibacter sp. TaxID=1131835 RepID=UPI0026248068|nr:peptidylprolyl isomerase [uncultured Piscinibacter sp.]
MTDALIALRPLLLALLLAAAAPATHAQARPAPVRTGDYIVAIVNQELVTASELQNRIRRVREDAARQRASLPPDDQLRREVLDLLIDERVQLTHARDSGQRIDEVELDRAVNNVALQNQITMAQLRERLRRDGIDYLRFRNNVRDQLLTERVREREVQGRIRVTDAEIDAWLDQRRAAASAVAEYNIAQILVTVPEGAGPEETARRRERAEVARKRVVDGEAFEAVARELSEDANRAAGGVIGLRSAERLPDVFVEVVRPLKPGEVAPDLLRTGAGFHVLKLVEKREGDAFRITQTRARHILLRPSAQLSVEAAQRRLVGFKQQIESGRATFEALARENSEDGSASLGGDLGWANAGTFVPEFEEAMNRLPLNGLSDPVVSRFGVHLLQVIERRSVSLDVRQQREQARNVLREQKFDEAYTEWLRELRARAYIEMREAPL